MVSNDKDIIYKKEEEEEPSLTEFKGKTLLVELSGGALLGGLSIVFGILVNPYVPALPGLGMKIFDLIAIPMILAYIVFGLKSGLLATIIGSLGILILPEPTAWIGMIAKFFATIPMIITPWLIFKTNKFTASKIRIINQIDENSINLGKYFPHMMIGAILVRFVLMFTLNLLIFLPLFTTGGTSLKGGLSVFTVPKVALLAATGLAAWNIVQGFLDAYIPYLIAYPTKLVNTFSTW